MIDTIKKLDGLMLIVAGHLESVQNSDLLMRPQANKWSKQEIIGHLIDSAINNLQRFTEIQFESKPFAVASYNQAALVLANNYQDADLHDLMTLWLSLNNRIKNIMASQTSDTLAYIVIINQQQKQKLRWLMIDYVDHLEHHATQITA